ncbi:hypothetical protein DINM_002215 [Dirofilaria immitis]|nr:hypothetical protein [Dirofilaria immitis]
MKAKVTVHFGNVAVVVPCYDYMTVNDLIKASIMRYKKPSRDSPIVHFIFKFDLCILIDIRYNLWNEYELDWNIHQNSLHKLHSACMMRMRISSVCTCTCCINHQSVCIYIVVQVDDDDDDARVEWESLCYALFLWY